MLAVVAMLILRASYQQLVNEVIINPHASEKSESDMEAVDHVRKQHFDYLCFSYCQPLSAFSHYVLFFIS